MIKKIFSGFFIGNTAQAALQFLMIPLLVRELGAVEYGQWGLLEPIIFIFSLIAQFGCNWGMIKLVNQDGLPVEIALRISFRQVFWPTTFSAIVAAVWSFYYFNNTSIYLLLPLVVIIETCLSLGLAASRSALNSRAYALGVVSKFGLLAVISLINSKSDWLLINSVQEWLFVYLLCVALSACLVLLLINSAALDACYLEEEISKYKISSRQYGFPILIAAILAAILNNADRYLVSGMLDPAVLGSYIVALKLAGAMNFLITPIALWWPTARFQHIKDQDGGQKFFSKNSILFVIGFSAAGTVLWIFSPLLLPYFSPGLVVDKFVLLPLIFGIVLRAIEPSLNIGLLQEGKTRILIYTTSITAIAQIAIGYLSILFFGVIGVAWSFFIVSLFGLIMINSLSQRVYRLKFNYYLLISIYILFMFISILVYELLYD